MVFIWRPLREPFVIFSGQLLYILSLVVQFCKLLARRKLNRIETPSSCDGMCPVSRKLSRNQNTETSRIWYAYQDNRISFCCFPGGLSSRETCDLKFGRARMIDFGYRLSTRLKTAVRLERFKSTRQFEYIKTFCFQPVFLLIFRLFFFVFLRFGKNQRREIKLRQPV